MKLPKSLYNLLFSAFFLLDLVPSGASIQCICESYMGGGCHGTCEAGSYCFKSWIVANGAVDEQGCVTTRSDLSDHKCQTNRKGRVTCLCDSDNCNDDSFSIPSDAELIVPPVLRCYSTGTGSTDVSKTDFCFGHLCTYQRAYIKNDFGDLIESEAADRGCSDAEYHHDVDSSNICTIRDSYVLCTCTSEFCNADQPHPVSIGKTLCYNQNDQYYTRPKKPKYCVGHMCYIQEEYLSTIRGCWSFSDGSPEELMRVGVYGRWKFCNEPLCNGVFSVEGSGDLGIGIDNGADNGTETV